MRPKTMQSAEIFFGRKFKQEKLYRVVSQKEY